MTAIYTAAEFRKAYGKHFKASPGSLEFDEKDVPAAVAALIPYAKFWGLTDDAEVGDLLDTVPLPLQHNLQEAVYSLNPALDIWLAGPEARSKDGPSLAYVAFSAMRIAADSVILPD